MEHTPREYTVEERIPHAKALQDRLNDLSQQYGLPFTVVAITQHANNYTLVWTPG